MLTRLPPTPSSVSSSEGSTICHLCPPTTVFLATPTTQLTNPSPLFLFPGSVTRQPAARSTPKVRCFVTCLIDAIPSHLIKAPSLPFPLSPVVLTSPTCFSRICAITRRGLTDKVISPRTPIISLIQRCHVFNV